jgi:diguanylate cyclase (GGDEF)-like protein
MAYYDSLTGLANRRMFHECFRRMLTLKRRQEGRFALILFDMDRFKEVNDTYGHVAGDELLKAVAERLHPVVRESDCLARLGGDEFAILAAGLSDQEGIASLCAKIADTFSKPLLFEGKELAVTFSIGVAVYPDDGEGEGKLLQCADEALYRVKRAGRNGWRRCERV